jgi:2-keto-4-pentenoate hydratase/2-oxohepta-3-ene-1,7-dioic acid hydratase in catechol pathway
MTTSAIRTSWAEQFGRPDPKVVCVGLNYFDHAGESQMELPKAPLLFAKFANTLIGDGDPIVLPAAVGHVDAEAELAVVIGARARDVPAERAFEVVAGYTCANDLSAREVQFADGQWFRGKGFDGFCPLGPRIVPPEAFDPSDVRVVQRLNGEVLQDASTRLLIFDVATLIAYISATLTLERGDIILTGTPSGVGYFRDPKIALKDGDVVEVEVEGIGVLRNEVRAG